MRRRMMVVVGLALTLGVTASQGEWRKRIHKGGYVDEHPLANIDSLTFHEDTTMVMVPAGVFIMGDGEWYCCGEDEREVTLTRDFYIGQHDVTSQECDCLLGEP